MYGKRYGFGALLVLGAALLATPARGADIATLARDRCDVCHGQNGVSEDPQVPIIAGQAREFLAEALHDFKDRKRRGERYRPEGGEETDMNEVTARLSEAQIAALAEHYSRLPWRSASQPFDAARAKRGWKIYMRRCRRCHEDNGRRSEDDIGRLAGQWSSYLERQLQHFLDGTRKAPKKMARQLRRLQPGDVPLLLQFFAAQTD